MKIVAKRVEKEIEKAPLLLVTNVETKAIRRRAKVVTKVVAKSAAKVRKTENLEIIVAVIAVMLRVAQEKENVRKESMMKFQWRKILHQEECAHQLLRNHNLQNCQLLFLQ